MNNVWKMVFYPQESYSKPRCLKVTSKSLIQHCAMLNETFASEASFVYILSGQKFIENNKST